jgi:hypothetical protein
MALVTGRLQQYVNALYCSLQGKRTMTILTIASSKGGPGKTTMAELIVCDLASEGVNVVALDTDPTGGLSRWAARPYEGPALTCHHDANEARPARRRGKSSPSIDSRSLRSFRRCGPPTRYSLLTRTGMA